MAGKRSLLAALAFASCSAPTKQPVATPAPAPAAPAAAPAATEPTATPAAATPAAPELAELDESDRIADDGARLIVAKGHQGRITEVTTTPDGRFIATIADDRIARVFRTEGLREIARFFVTGTDPRLLAISANGARLALAYRDFVIVHDVLSTAELGRIPRTDGPGHDSCLAFHGNDLLLWRDGLVRWTAGAPLAKLSTSDAACQTMGLVGPATLVVQLGLQLHRGELRAATWTSTPGPKLAEPLVSTRPMVFGRGVVAWSGRDGVELWRTKQPAAKKLPALKTGRLALVDGGTALIHSAATTSRVVLASGATTTLAPHYQVSALGTGKVVVVDEETLCTADSKTGAIEVCRGSSTGSVRSLAVSKDGRLVVGADRAPLRAWSTGFPTELQRYSAGKDPATHGTMALSPDGTHVAQAVGRSIVVRPVAGDVPRELRHDTKSWPSYEGVAWSPDGAWIVTTLDKDVVRLRVDGRAHEIISDVISDRWVPRWFQRHGRSDAFAAWYRRIRVPAYRADGDVLALAANDRVVLIRGGKVTATLAGPTQLEPVVAIAFRPGTRELVVGFADGHVRSWDTDAPEAPIRDRDLGAPVAALAFDQAGSALLVSADDGRVRVFGGDEAAPRTVIDTHQPTAIAVALLPNGRIATGHLDGVVRVFRPGSAKVRSRLTAELFALDSHAHGRADWVVVGYDGRFEASLEGNGVAFYGVRAGELVPHARFVDARRRFAVLEAALLEPAARPRRAAPGPTVVPQTWTAHAFWALAFTPDGKELLGNSQDGVYAFDLETGLLRARLVPTESTTELVTSNTAFYRRGTDGLEVHDRVTGERFASQRHKGQLVGRTAAGEIVARGPEGLTVYAEAPLRVLRTAAEAGVTDDWVEAVSADGTVIATSRQDGMMRLWAAATLKERPAIRCAPEPVVSIAVSAKGAWVACAMVRGTIVVTRTDQPSAFVVRPDAFASAGIQAMEFHPTRPMLAIATSTGGFLYDLVKRTQVRFDIEERQYTSIAWSPDGGTLAMAAAGGAIHLFDPAGARLRMLSPTQIGKIDRIGRVRPGVLAIREGLRLRTWDAATGHERAVDGRSSQSDFAWTPDGSARAVQESPGIVVTTATGATSLAMDFVEAVALASDAKRVFVATSHSTIHDWAEIAGYEVATQKRLWTQRFDAQLQQLASARTSGDLGMVVYNRAKAVGLPTLYKAIVMSADGRTTATYSPPAGSASYLRYLLALDDKRWLLTEDTKLMRWDPATGKTEKTAIPAESLALSPDGKRVVATSRHEVYVVDAGALAQQAHARFPSARITQSVFVTDDVIATLIEDGSVVLWTLRGGTLERAGMLIATARRGMVLVSPQGHYMAGAEAASALGFSLGPAVFRFEQFDSALNRPHLALGALGVATQPTLALYEAAYAKRKKRRALEVTTATRLQVPTVELVTRVPLRATADKLAIKLRADGRSTVIARVNVRVNGVPLLGRNGLDVLAKRQTVVELAHEVPLEIGINRIEVEAENEQGVLALGGAAIVTREGKAKQGALHVISIGVSKYGNGNDLEYAAKDADDVARAIAGVAAHQGVVTKTVLRDAQVTRAAVLALRAQLERTAIEDTVIVFVAGHGLLDADDQYVFATHDISFETAANGIRFGELESLLDGIPARRKILMLDTCHAGELDAEELAYITQAELAGKRGVRRVKRPPVRSAIDPRARAVAARALFTELRRGAGVTVIAASAGAEYSYEDGAIKNGLFSHAFIAGLGGQADRDRDGAIRVSELLEFVTTTVAKQSGGFQVPQARELNRDLDFDLTPGRHHPPPWRSDTCNAKLEIGANAQGQMTVTESKGTLTYTCGGMLAASELANQPTAAKELDRLASELSQTILAASASSKITWTNQHGLAGVKQARTFRVTVPGYRLDAFVGWIAVDPATKRAGMCLAIDALPAAIARCKRVVPVLLQATPPQQLP